MARKYVKKNFIARGSHGDVYSGINAHTEEEVAIKLELISKSSNHLENESKLYRLLGTHGKNSTVITHRC